MALARRIASDYERLIEMVGPSSAWLNLNRVLVTCGDDDMFRSLLNRFGCMEKQAQDCLAYAVVARGAQWIAPFQKVAFSSTDGRHHQKLRGELSPDIDDATAREWIAAGYDDIGWRVLISRHGNALIPELLEALPPSFAGIHHIPALANMRFLKDAPPSLVDELWRRVGNPMQPKATEDLLYALAAVYPQGVASIVRHIAEHPNIFPAYHIRRTIELYETWKKRFGFDLGIRMGDREMGPFPRWIATHCALQRWEDHFTPMMLATVPDVAVGFVLDHLQFDDEKAAAVLRELRNLMTYSGALLDRMLAVPVLAALIPNVFAGCLEGAPANALQRCLACPDIDQEMLLFRLSSTNNPLHRPVHSDLIRRLLGQALNLSNFRQLAGMLRGYSRHDILDLLESAYRSNEDDWIWLVRTVEDARGERLINEAGYVLR